MDGKIYVGKTNDVSRRWAKHKSDARLGRDRRHLYNAMRAHGIDRFTLEVVSHHTTDEEAYAAEKAHVARLISEGVELYNANEGGEGMSNPSEETRAKMSRSQRGKKHTIEHNARISSSTTGENNPMFGRRHSQESIERNATSNRIAQAGERNAMFGKKHSQESRARMSEDSVTA